MVVVGLVVGPRGASWESSAALSVALSLHLIAVAIYGKIRAGQWQREIDSLRSVRDFRESGLTGVTRNHVSPCGSGGSNPPSPPHRSYLLPTIRRQQQIPALTARSAPLAAIENARQPAAHQIARIRLCSDERWCHGRWGRFNTCTDFFDLPAAVGTTVRT